MCLRPYRFCPRLPVVPSAIVADIETMEARNWEAWTALLAEDVVYEVPQTRERVSGRAALLRFNQEYPGDWHHLTEQY
jgi:hypothetical protein